jgi:trimethylamine:corrinoid methyltransferase-like protein
MSDREAFEKWWPSVGQTIGKVAAWEAWQAALQHSGEPVVDEAVFDILKAAQGSCRLGFNDIADKQIEIAIKALLSAGEETI